jgi:hypothetical protein
MYSTPLMFGMSVAAALLSSMSFWADKWSDMRLSLNDWYMAFLMTGWMFLFEGLASKMMNWFLMGVGLIFFSLVFIRGQVFVSKEQYIAGMIPHHSMAVKMSKELMAKYGADVLERLPSSIIDSQETEIRFLKAMEQTNQM